MALPYLLRILFQCQKRLAVAGLRGLLGLLRRAPRGFNEWTHFVRPVYRQRHREGGHRLPDVALWRGASPPELARMKK